MFKIEGGFYVQEKIIKFNNVSFRYEERSPLVIKNVSLTIYKGEWVSIVGHNGSGKSTLAKFMNALYVPESGEVFVDNMLTKNEETHKHIRRKVAMVFQHPDNQFVAPTVEDDVAFGLENSGVPYETMVQLVQESIDKMGLNGLEKHEPHRLSGGQKQRVALAGAIAMRPEVLVLDEATSMLDPSGRNEVMRFVQKLQIEEKMTIVTITHDLTEATLSDRIVVMKDGEIIGEGTPQRILSDSQLLREARLKEPFIIKLTNKLREKGIELPNHILSQEQLVEELCKLKVEM